MNIKKPEMEKQMQIKNDIGMIDQKKQELRSMTMTSKITPSNYRILRNYLDDKKASLGDILEAVCENLTLKNKSV